MENLQNLIDEKKVTPRVLALLQHEVLDAIAARWWGNDESDLVSDSNASYEGSEPAQAPSGEILASGINIDLKTREVTLSPVGDKPSTMAADIAAFGKILKDALAVTPTANKRLLSIAEQCISGGFAGFGHLQLAIEKRVSNSIYIPLIFLIIILVTLLAWLNSGQLFAK
ncbi:MAG: hypothetical protein LKF31_02790 [Muribaculaceae bacterium]|jgi:hypothetical protein|nr:hypothetical protein [Muribaculaceae bacterium]